MKKVGYSGTPLAEKLGIKPGFTIKLVNQPSYYFKLFTDLPADLTIETNPAVLKHLIHFFVKDVVELASRLEDFKKEIGQNGMIWVSWPKKSSGVETSITEDVIRENAFACGLVDIKVCAIDEVWSGLKLVIPVKDRA
jgi:hypothetical protein